MNREGRGEKKRNFKEGKKKKDRREATYEMLELSLGTWR